MLGGADEGHWPPNRDRCAALDVLMLLMTGTKEKNIVLDASFA